MNQDDKYIKAQRWLEQRYGIEEFDEEDWRALVEYYRQSTAPSQPEIFIPQPLSDQTARQMNRWELFYLQGEALMYAVEHPPKVWPAIRVQI